jgi:thiol-disulfide isomerase/thioredoxin
MTILLAGLIGLGAGAMAFYWTGGPARNASSAACTAAGATAAKLQPLARGEVAAFKVTEAPMVAPNLAFKAPDGRQLTMADFRGRMVLLNLWATWCAPCRKEMPQLVELQSKLGSDDFEVVAVSVDRKGLDASTAFLKSIGADALKPYIDIPAASINALKSPGLPTTVLVDRQGREIGRLLGPADWASPEALKLVQAALAEK